MTIKSKNISIIIDNQVITCNSVIVKELTINRSINEVGWLGSSEYLELPSNVITEVSISFVVKDADFFMEIFEDGIDNTKVSRKVVDDCSVQELLFAARHKLKEPL